MVLFIKLVKIRFIHDAAHMKGIGMAGLLTVSEYNVGSSGSEFFSDF